MSPMFTVCHAERRRMRRGRASAAGNTGRDNTAAPIAGICARNWRRFTVKDEKDGDEYEAHFSWRVGDWTHRYLIPRISQSTSKEPVGCFPN